MKIYSQYFYAFGCCNDSLPKYSPLNVDVGKYIKLIGLNIWIPCLIETWSRTIFRVTNKIWFLLKKSKQNDFLNRNYFKISQLQYKPSQLCNIVKRWSNDKWRNLRLHKNIFSKLFQVKINCYNLYNVPKF